MIRRIADEYMPDYVSPPGETLLETLETIGMSQAELAARTGRPRKMINEIVKGKAPITSETALQLEKVLGVPARFWMNREQQYREALARAEERERLQAQVAWLKELPISAMMRMGWIEPTKDETQQTQEALRYFGVASPAQWRDLWCKPKAALRQSRVFEADPGAVAAWLRAGELEAQQIACRGYDAGAFLKTLLRIRTLTVKPPEEFVPALVEWCAAVGVAVAFVRELPKIRASGATRWLSPVKALIQLSLRYKTDDQLWFTFFHEAGHILKHGKRDVFVEGDNAGDAREREADRFASELLIPAAELRGFLDNHEPRTEPIRVFASQLGIAPGIVVGRLQHDGVIPHSWCNELKVRLEWKDEAER